MNIPIKVCSCGEIIDLQAVEWLGIMTGLNGVPLKLLNCNACNSTLAVRSDTADSSGLEFEKLNIRKESVS